MDNLILVPCDSQNLTIDTKDGPVTLTPEDAIALMKNAKSNGLTVILRLRGGNSRVGFYTVNESVRQAAISLAGLDGYAAAKQSATGEIVIAPEDV